MPSAVEPAPLPAAPGGAEAGVNEPDQRGSTSSGSRVMAAVHAFLWTALAAGPKLPSIGRGPSEQMPTQWLMAVVWSLWSADTKSNTSETRQLFSSA
jgi:hypothetical protein